MLQLLSLIANYRGLEHFTNKNFKPLRSLLAIKGWTPRTLAPQPKESGPARHRQDRKCVLPAYHYQWGCEHGKADKRMLHDINTIILLLKLLKIPAKCCFNWNFFMETFIDARLILKCRIWIWNFKKLLWKIYLKSKWLNLVLNVNSWPSKFWRWFFHIHWIHCKIEGIVKDNLLKKSVLDSYLLKITYLHTTCSMFGIICRFFLKFLLSI